VNNDENYDEEYTVKGKDNKNYNYNKNN